jgi:hypothetical protein
MEYDDRGFCVAVVADELLNDNAAGFDVLGVIDRAGWGVVALPPAWYCPDLAGPLLEHVAEHVEEFARHGYAIVLIGERDGLGEALGHVGVPMPERVQAQDAEQLAAELARRAAAVRPRDAAAYQRSPDD